AGNKSRRLPTLGRNMAVVFVGAACSREPTKQQTPIHNAFTTAFGATSTSTITRMLHIYNKCKYL
ncbi:hypothetical protein, partial [Hydrogenophaga sp.]|uniref:hypothetical protein n=2 Tax=Betaproteobacteria TaxID=28216 RepID=UPI00273778B7